MMGITSIYVVLIWFTLKTHSQPAIIFGHRNVVTLSALYLLGPLFVSTLNCVYNKNLLTVKHEKAKFKEQGQTFHRFCFFFRGKKTKAIFGSEPSHFELGIWEVHILDRISWRIQSSEQNLLGMSKSNCNSRQFMSDQNFRKIHEKCFLCRISRQIEWYHPLWSTGSESASKWTFSISRFDLNMFSRFRQSLSYILKFP